VSGGYQEMTATEVMSDAIRVRWSTIYGTDATIAVAAAGVRSST
jgi:hypothetical protein